MKEWEREVSDKHKEAREGGRVKNEVIFDRREENYLRGQIEELANFILENFPNEPGGIGKSEGAIEVAIRLLKHQVVVVNSHDKLLQAVSRAINACEAYRPIVEISNILMKAESDARDAEKERKE